MARNVLQTIVEARKQCIDLEKTQHSYEKLEKSARSLYQALSQPNLGFIMECKKASPSKGLIRENFKLEEILQVYKKFAAAISVLTEPDYFAGDDQNLSVASRMTELPILCKDFIFDEFQIKKARYFGADAVLLMLSVLDDSQYRALAEVASHYDLDVLTEVHSEEELERALSVGAKIIGINNRDLSDLSIDLETSRRMAPKLPADVLTISESGIETMFDVYSLKDSVDGFLVGSSLMAADNLFLKCSQLVCGDVKICGLTRKEDLLSAQELGASYAGLIFAEHSPRKISDTMARELSAASQIPLVGVFAKQSPEFVCGKVSEFKLSVVQLHGNENADYVKALRARLPESTEIWLALPFDEDSKNYEAYGVDKILLDSKHDGQFGGTGQVGDWSVLSSLNSKDYVLAGGLSPENIAEARQCWPGLLDVNSGVESAPGVKDREKIAALFAALRTAL